VSPAATAGGHRPAGLAILAAVLLTAVVVERLRHPSPTPGGRGARRREGLATLLFDLLTTREELDRANVLDVGLLAGRLTEVTSWVRARPDC
jgi:hypothetical protein